MNTTTVPALKEIEMKMFNEGKKVFSGMIKDLPEFKVADQPVDLVKFFNDNGSVIMSMKYEEFEKMVEEELI